MRGLFVLGDVDRVRVSAQGITLRGLSLIGQRGRPSSDADLIDAVRDGKVEEYGKLYERHVRSATMLAMQLSSSSSDADDLVAEAFAKVLAALRGGGGPGAAFRPYLLTAVRHAAYDRTRKEKRLELAGDIEEVHGATKATSVPFRDKPVEDLDQAMAATAFATLPERWQTVLWHTAIEGQSPGEIAPLLGLTANGVSAMAFRAREGLRKAFLQAHINQEPTEKCRATVTKLGAWTRGGLKGRDAVQLDAHMDDCAECRKLASELSDVNGALRGLVAPIVLGTGTAGYLAAAATATKGAAVTVSLSSWLGVAASAAAVVVVAASGVVSSDGGPSSTIGGAAPTTGTSTSEGVAQSSQPGQPGSPQNSGSAPTGATAGSVAPGAGTSGAAGPATTTNNNTIAPAAASLSGSAPSGIAMTTEGPANEMNINITNNGTAPTTVPTLTLTMPDKIKTVGPGKTSAGMIGCPAGKGTVTCEGGQTLAPGQTITFRARLQAGPKAGDGVITGVAGPVQVSIPITIAQAQA
ncbi:RNA polymerase sigma factor (sigma-70 family) [Lentzea flaviverrucosa]|uniref:RNA polymerase sigma factor, sigma-70 family n=1 Tax=Lentzea flaviverrucosa TaxID=200379 RepID=A0A1H9XDY4_9PSEU|nr:RNA polymerase sigma factor (sigma-70 family) [Lentzea flaviverrucosa]SES44332.1 RNA polymerase sigma factor, sigma-70 family [Lentzea flaviverrucosa]